MPTINQLPSVDQVTGGDNLVLWVPDQGDSRRCPASTFAEYVASNLGDASATTVQTEPTTFAQLPTAATAGAGTRAFITDSSTATFAATVSGGGANRVPVYSDGTNWKVG